MKKYFYLFLMMLFVASCSKDDDNNDISRLENAYINLKNNISGSWVMDAYHSTSRPGLYKSLGWDEDMIFMELNAMYKLSFTKEGNFNDHKGSSGTYSIYIDEDKEVYYGEYNSDFYWPFDAGAIYLKINCGENFQYNDPYYAEIKNDGKLYLYNTVTPAGGDGVPMYRYKRQ